MYRPPKVRPKNLTIGGRYIKIVGTASFFEKIFMYVSIKENFNFADFSFFSTKNYQKSQKTYQKCQKYNMEIEIMLPYARVII